MDTKLKTPEAFAEWIKTERFIMRMLNGSDEELESHIHSIYGAAIEASGLQKRIGALEAERQEQISIIESCGPIICRNGVNHTVFEGCLYCEADYFKIKAKKLEAALAKTTSHARSSANRFWNKDVK